MERFVMLARFVALVVLVVLFALDLYAQPFPGSAVVSLPPHGAAAEPGPSLERAILAELELPHRRPDGSAWYARHCREAHGGCPARAARMAALFEASARRHGVDAWTLAAIAMHESGGNPDAIGARGELGLMQLHPRGRHGAIAARICDAQPRACAAAIVDGAAALLASAIARCGDERRALSAYNSGSCDRRLEYSNRIVARRERMRGAR